MAARGRFSERGCEEKGSVDDEGGEDLGSDGGRRSLGVVVAGDSSAAVGASAMKASQVHSWRNEWQSGHLGVLPLGLLML